jgi:alpha-1,3-rhamnosyl/mannosyltransferase
MAREVQGIEWIGYVDDTSWSSILAESSILAFPSLEEGFGLPVLDAFRQGVPVLTSGRSSMREIAGSAALLVDPLDERSICAGLHSLLTDSLLCKRLVNEGFERAEKFTWQACVERILRALKSLNTRDIMGGL